MIVASEFPNNKSFRAPSGPRKGVPPGFAIGAFLYHHQPSQVIMVKPILWQERPGADHILVLQHDEGDLYHHAETSIVARALLHREDLNKWQRRALLREANIEYRYDPLLNLDTTHAEVSNEALLDWLVKAVFQGDTITQALIMDLYKKKKQKARLRCGRDRPRIGRSLRRVDLRGCRECIGRQGMARQSQRSAAEEHVQETSPGKAREESCQEIEKAHRVVQKNAIGQTTPRC